MKSIICISSLHIYYHYKAFSLSFDLHPPAPTLLRHWLCLLSFNLLYVEAKLILYSHKTWLIPHPSQANKYYRMFITWTNQKIRQTFVHRNMFDFKHIKPFDKSYMDNPGPMVVFATPGMLHAGLSLAIFKKWAPNHSNMVSKEENSWVVELMRVYKSMQD